ncbi:hypothetical protein [Adonisia turfae]|uniref:hypothetical protein n=1 Tax=Adonisia turfae TaxID=2950184 RepID=UPI0013D072DB|nr:hypothetical protein [Adonisia turfae]
MGYDPDYVANEIEECERQIEHLRHRIKELKSQPVMNANGDLKSYADHEQK